jgi:hypothetical protein
MQHSFLFHVLAAPVCALLFGLAPSPAQAGLSYWDGPGYGRDNYSGENGIPGEDGKGVELQGSAEYGNPGNGGNETNYVPGSAVWMVFEVISSRQVNFGNMKVYINDPSNGWQSFSMLSDSGYGGPGYRYWLQLVVSDQAWADLPPSDEIYYFFEDFELFDCLPAGACYGAPYLDAPNFFVQEPGAAFQVELSDTPADLLPGEMATWDIDLTNIGSESGSTDLWMQVEGPITRQLYQQSGITLAPGDTYHRQYVVRVPGSAPAGVYTVTAYSGTYPSSVESSDSFTCEMGP